LFRTVSILVALKNRYFREFLSEPSVLRLAIRVLSSLRLFSRLQNSGFIFFASLFAFAGRDRWRNEGERMYTT